MCFIESSHECGASSRNRCLFGDGRLRDRRCPGSGRTGGRSVGRLHRVADDTVLPGNLCRVDVEPHGDHHQRQFHDPDSQLRRWRPERPDQLRRFAELCRRRPRPWRDLPVQLHIRAGDTRRSHVIDHDRNRRRQLLDHDVRPRRVPADRRPDRRVVPGHGGRGHQQHGRRGHQRQSDGVDPELRRRGADRPDQFRRIAELRRRESGWRSVMPVHVHVHTVGTGPMVDVDHHRCRRPGLRHLAARHRRRRVEHHDNRKHQLDHDEHHGARRRRRRARIRRAARRRPRWPAQSSSVPAVARWRSAMPR